MFLSENFTLEELTASNKARAGKIDNSPSSEIICNLSKLAETVLQPVRDKFGKPIIVTSGYRSRKLNKLLKGSSTSQHLKGEAADIISGDNKRLFDLIKNMISNGEIYVGQLINEHDLRWIHISLPDSRHHNQILEVGSSGSAILMKLDDS